MTLDEATSEAILGARITSDSVQAGAYVYYNFNGLRIAFPCGSSSGWSPTWKDKLANWQVLDAQPVAVGVGRVMDNIIHSSMVLDFKLEHGLKLDPNKGGW